MERSFAHCYETGGMRRTHLRGHENILKRQLCRFSLLNRLTKTQVIDFITLVPSNN